jgi:hypothetical protein
MNWLKRKLRHWANSDQYANEIKLSEAPINLTRSRHDRIESTGFNIRVFKANGGIIVETEGYDNRTDRHLRGLHVIMEHQDIGHELGKIISIESLKL